MSNPQSATLTCHPKALKQLAKLEPAVSGQAFKFMMQFQQNVNLPALKFQRLQGHQHLYSARVAKGYRALLRHVRGHHYLLVAILPRGDVYERLDERMAYFVNETTGGIEVINPSEINRITAADVPAPTPTSRTARNSAAPAPQPLFDGFTSTELVDVGVSAELLPSVRNLHTETGLFRLADELPPHTAEVLVELAAGIGIDEVMEKITAPIRPDEPVDPTDFVAAVERPATQAIHSDDPSVTAILSDDFEAWRTFLHPAQRAFVDRDYQGPARVSGGPGTGKTVVALHRAARLARGLAPGQKILVTTYNANLAADLATKLKSLLSPKEFARVETKNIDKLARSIADESGSAHPVQRGDTILITYWRQILDAAAETEFTPEFCLDEWHHVVCGQMVTSSSQYLTVRRAGRGRRLNRSERIRLWKLFETFNTHMADRQRRTFAQVNMQAALAEEKRVATEPARYAHVVVDEAQDLSRAQWRLLRALVAEGPNDLFIVGDTHQRIYGTPLALAPLGINIRGRSARLTLSYRTTREILGAALGLVSGETFDDLDGDTETLAGYRSIMTGPQPRFISTDTEDAQWDAVIDQLRDWSGMQPADIAVCAPNRKQVETILARLRAAGIAAGEVDKNGPPKNAVIHVATMNRLKGLEYRHLIITGIGAEDYPRPYVTQLVGTDPIAYRQELKKERCLLFVAATRVRDALTVIWRGEPCLFLSGADHT